ncbi:ATPase AAA-type core domain-containing protein [Methylorubrum aminovorans]
MRISKIKLAGFRRFVDLEIRDIPHTAKLVVLAGPNGSGKSSLFDALLYRYRYDSGIGAGNDPTYYSRIRNSRLNPLNSIEISFHGRDSIGRGAVYVRSAYRNDPDFLTSSLSRQGEVLDSLLLSKLIETDATVSKNYARLASQAMEDIFVNEAASTTVGDYRDKLIGEVREPLRRLFPELVLVGIGNPLSQGTFHFDKGTAQNFQYKNLSGGEKAAFDLILDIVVKRKSYQNAIYCIDEPETHMNTKVKSALLQELLNLIPPESQLLVASHSIGMMRKAKELYDADPSSVVFLDFGGRDFDNPTLITPQKPTRAFWESVLHVALDDLAHLVAPREVVICEGNPATPDPSKNAEHDAQVYSTIFKNEMPDVTFVSAGSAKQVSGDFLALATTLPKVAAGMRVRRLIDLDDHAPEDISTFNRNGITVLSRRHLEAYLFDDEVLTALCKSVGKPQDAPQVIAAKQQAIASSTTRGNPPDDIKSAAGTIYIETKRILGLTQVGNDKSAFARNSLAPLITPGLGVYSELKRDIFGI